MPSPVVRYPANIFPTTFPIYDWESEGKEVESGRKRYEGVASGRTKYDAVESGRKRYNSVGSGTMRYTTEKDFISLQR